MASSTRLGLLLAIVYDSQLQLWKIYVVSTAPKNFDNYGEQEWMGGIEAGLWDVQNDHATYATTTNPNGLKIFWDKEMPERYRDIVKYGTPAGLSMLMQ